MLGGPAHGWQLPAGIFAGSAPAALLWGTSLTTHAPRVRRRLWEAGQAAGSQPVVGVVGAGHVKVRANSNGRVLQGCRWGKHAVRPEPSTPPTQPPRPPQGIARYWAHAGEPETEEAVARYLRAPEEDRGSPLLAGAMTAAVLGTIAYRRPRAAALFCGAVALMSAPYLGFMVRCWRECQGALRGAGVEG